MPRRTQKNVGVIGLGIIGRRVADCVRRAGFSTFVWNRTPRPFPNFVGSPAEIAELCDFIQIFVSDDEALLQVVQRMKQSLGSHHIILAHSTVSPATTRAAAEIVQRRGAQLLDAPFTGSKLAAEKGELVYYIGGDDAAYRRARPVLEASSKEIIEIGEIGQATTIKIATNMVTAATVQVTAEAMALVHSSGLALEKFAEAMQGNGSNSGTLKMKLPKMMAGDFEPHFSVKHMLKDVEIASRMARSYGLALPATEAARDGLLDEARNGRNDDDYSSIARVFFPDGPPGKTQAKQSEEEEQSVLTGLDERALPQMPPERAEVEAAKEAVARNGNGAMEVPRQDFEDKKIDEPPTEKQEEVVEEQKAEEPTVAKSDEPEEKKPDEAIAEKIEAPSAEKREEEIVAKVAEEEKREEKVEEKIEEKRIELIEDKREEPTPEKIEKPSEEKREEAIETKKEERIPAKIEEPKETKREEVREEVFDKTETEPLQSVVSETAVAVKEVVTVEKEEEPEVRRSFLSRLFGKADS